MCPGGGCAGVESCVAQVYLHKPYLIDKFPVTQAAFSAYLLRRGAQALPKDRHRYL